MVSTPGTETASFPRSGIVPCPHFPIARPGASQNRAAAAWYEAGPPARCEPRKLHLAAVAAVSPRISATESRTRTPTWHRSAPSRSRRRGTRLKKRQRYGRRPSSPGEPDLSRRREALRFRDRTDPGRSTAAPAPRALPGRAADPADVQRGVGGAASSGPRPLLENSPSSETRGRSLERTAAAGREAAARRATAARRVKGRAEAPRGPDRRIGPGLSRPPRLPSLPRPEPGARGACRAVRPARR